MGFDEFLNQKTIYKGFLINLQVRENQPLNKKKYYKMKKINISYFAVLLAFFLMFIYSSCRKTSPFYEMDNLSSEMEFEGSVAAPIVNTRFHINSYLPEGDSSLWMTFDENDLAHFRMYLHLGEYTSNELINNIPYPAGSGFVIPSFTTQIETNSGKLKIYANSLSGHLYFNDPKITLRITNDIPILTFFKIDTLEFFNQDMKSISKTLGSVYTINSPLTKGIPALTDIVIDKTSMPELPDVFSPVPKYTSFSLSVGSPDNQAIPFGIDGTEKLNIDADIDLPLDARLTDFMLGDTVAFSFDTNYDNVNSATLKIELENGFPFDAYTQIYFADTTANGSIGNMIDSVFADVTDPNISGKGWLLNPSNVNSSGVVTSSNKTMVQITLTRERLQNLIDKKSSQILITTKLNTYKSNEPDKLYIKIYSYYIMGVKIGIKADYNMSTK